MKVRKKEIKVRKNFFVPPWIFHDIHGGIFRFPPSLGFFHGNVNKLIRYGASALIEAADASATGESLC